MAGLPLHTGQAGPLPVPRPVTSERLEIKAYRILTRLARPAAPFILRLREKRGKEDPNRLGERLGKPSVARPGGAVAWVHAASVGETSAVLPVVAALEARRPDLTVLLTTGTVTSARFAAARISRRTVHQYIPLDEASFVASFLDHWRPGLGVFTEQEVWPNLVLSAAQRGIPLALVNARMSERSFDRWQRRSGVAEALFSRFAVVLAQNEALAQRFETIGARRVVAAGNLKVDAPAPPVDAAAFSALAAALGGRPRIVAASTHDTEELAVAEAHRRLKGKIDGLVSIIAPRHPERGEAIANAVGELGLAVSRRSAGALPDASTDVYVADTIGELGTFYATAPIAFVGGSLIPHGGQNPIEAVRHGAVVVTGSSTHNFADAYAALVGAGGAIRVAGVEELAPTLALLLKDPARTEAMRVNATRALQGLSGALERTVAALLPYLPDRDGELAATGDA
jgi:3-deoxy-D-manno-octulosonic-acid transferase